MVEMKEIARIAGVSVSTVSNVLNGRKNVGQATRERVLQICKENGYIPNTMRKKVKIDKNKTILFIFSDFDRDFYLKIFEGVSDFLAKNGYDLIICTNKSSAKFMRGKFADGAISLDGSLTDDFLISVAKPGFPIVLMDRILMDEHGNTKSVVVDNYPVMCEMMQVLVDKGYKHFGYIGGHEYTLDNTERFAGFIDTLSKNKITFDHKKYFYGDYREKSGYQAAKIMILSNELPEVLICANDNMAIGAIRAFEENNIKVPEDIAVTGFDDSVRAVIAGLTTITIPRYESGYLAAKELLDLMDGSANKEPLKLTATINWRMTVK
ncbi:LacI family DNA-binding transcriptional regulator [Paenibacillus sp. IHBB 10380]|uniref:LacI family DNA-binding transcriptional regulator n=1 Tax=Paenibacillus sp. IHBB 10380 TaxID=1566358 RepID=UPI0005CF9879|nr:LacI family DNA-binding transcriptional regulator [Paenibacillus sp. IHBB 10380]AJS58152.1 LacI family transcriptional regulator [Paenibacillus sp. IHBB 10380]